MRNSIARIGATTALALGIWTLAVNFTPIASDFKAGDQVSASAFNSLFATITDNFTAAKTAIEANERAIGALTAPVAVSVSHSEEFSIAELP